MKFLPVGFLFLLLCSINLFPGEFSPDYLTGYFERETDMVPDRKIKDSNIQTDLIDGSTIRQNRFLSAFDLLFLRTPGISSRSFLINGTYAGGDKELLRCIPADSISEAETTSWSMINLRPDQKSESVNIVTSIRPYDKSSFASSRYFSSGRMLTSAKGMYSSGLISGMFYGAFTSDCRKTANEDDLRLREKPAAVVTSARGVHTDSITSTFSSSYYSDDKTGNALFSSSYGIFYDYSMHLSGNLSAAYTKISGKKDRKEYSETSKCADAGIKLTPFTFIILRADAGGGVCEYIRLNEKADYTFRGAAFSAAFTTEHVDINSSISASAFEIKKFLRKTDSSASLKFSDGKIRLFGGCSMESFYKEKNVSNSKLVLPIPSNENSLYGGLGINYYDYFFVKSIISRVYEKTGRNRGGFKGTAFWKSSSNSDLNLRYFSAGIIHEYRKFSEREESDLFISISFPSGIQPYLTATAKLKNRMTDECIAGAEASIPLFSVRIEIGVNDILNNDEEEGGRELTAGTRFYF